MKFIAVAIFMYGGHFDKEKSFIFRQFVSIAGLVRSFMLAYSSNNFARTTNKIHLNLFRLLEFELELHGQYPNHLYLQARLERLECEDKLHPV